MTYAMGCSTRILVLIYIAAGAIQWGVLILLMSRGVKFIKFCW